jgi:hypothetical protein
MPSNNKRPLWQRVGTDILGFAMLLAVPLVGWLPGPGGIPLLLGGLGLLSLNHEWAKRLLHEVKTKGTNIYEVIFPENKKIYLVYDFLGVQGLIISIYFATVVTKSFTLALSIAGIFFTSGLLLANRKRLDKITRFIKSQSKK